MSASEESSALYHAHTLQVKICIRQPPRGPKPPISRAKAPLILGMTILRKWAKEDSISQVLLTLNNPIQLQNSNNFTQSDPKVLCESGGASIPPAPR